MDAVLREYRVEDIPVILTIIKSAFAEQRGLVDPPSSAEHKTIDNVNEELKSSNALVVDAGGKLVACVFYQPKGDSIYFDRLSVLKDYRRRGIAKTLIDEVEKRAAETGFRKMSLSVRIELKNQQAYYHSMGYRIVRHEAHEGYTRPTFVVMEKELAR